MTRGSTLHQKRRGREWHELDLLVSSGMGLVSTAPSICSALRRIIGAAAASLFWLDEQSMPVGVFHENPAPDALDLFINEYDRLFVGSAEINVSQIASARGRPAGFLLRPDPHYLRSNTLNLLVRPSGHYHTLDLRVDLAGRARAVVMLFREERHPFESRDAVLLEEAIPYLQKSLGRAGRPSTWVISAHRGHLVVDRFGTELVMMDDEARTLLQACTLVGQGISLLGGETNVPRFIRELCIRIEGNGAAECEVEVGAGRLRATASKLTAPGNKLQPQALISLEMLRPKPLLTIERLLDLPLSPLQRSIALDAALGGARADSPASTGVGKEALKKHLAVIYRTLGVSSWEELARELD